MLRQFALVVVSLCVVLVITKKAHGEERILKNDQTLDILCLAYSPDGGLLASGGVDTLVHLWNAKTGELVRTLKGHPSLVYCLAFSPDGKVLASGSYAARRTDNSLILWDVKTGRMLHGIPAASSFDVYAVGFSPDGKTVASGGDDYLINVWDVQSGKGKMIRRHGQVSSLHFLPTGKSFVVGGRSTEVFLLDADNGSVIRRFRGHTQSVRHVDLSPDGKTLATASTDGMMKIWDLATGDLLRSIEGAGTDVKFSPDGNLLVTLHHDKPESPGTIRLFELKSGKLVYELQGHTHMIQAVAFSPDGKSLASASYDHTIRFWDLPSLSTLDLGAP